MQESASRRNADIGADTVNREIVRAGALPIDAELAGIRACRRSENRAGSEIDERLKASAVQREILYKIVVNDRTHRGVLRVDRAHAGFHRHALRQRTHFQLKIQGDHVLNVQFQSLLNGCLEALFLHDNAVGTCRKGDYPEKPFIIRFAVVGDVCFDVGRLNCCTGHPEAFGVGHVASQRGQLLAQNQPGSQGKQQN